MLPSPLVEYMVYFFVALAGILIITLMILQGSGGIDFPWVSFFVKGKEAGFSLGEINLLRKAAVQTRLKNPASLFWSEKTLDRCIKAIIVQQRSRNISREGAADHDDEQDESAEQPTGTVSQDELFTSKLFDFRTRVEFNLPRYRLGISSSRNITAGQYMKILLPGAGVYTSKLVENLRRYMAISYPEGKALPPGFNWRGQKVKVYFWRQEDAGYSFETEVLGDYTDKQFPILHIRHSDSLMRTQKRSSVRATLNSQGYLYRLSSISEANDRIEHGGGYRVRFTDISSTGAAIMIGGRGKAGMPVKLQLELEGQPVVMCGVVKDVTYKELKNLSILHVEAVEPGPVMKNRILSFVYGIFRSEK